MCLRTKTDQIPRSDTTKRYHPHGSNKNPRSCGLAKTDQRHRSPILLRVHWFLSILYPKLLKNRKTATRPHQKDDRMALGRTTKTSVRKAQNVDVSTTGTSSAELRTTVRSTH